MLKLALLGVLGYAGWRYYETTIKPRQGGTPEVPLVRTTEEDEVSIPQTPAEPVPI